MLLVTNQLQYAPEADTVLYLEEGEMVACGKYDEVVQNQGFASLLNEYEVSSQHERSLQLADSSSSRTGFYMHRMLALLPNIAVSTPFSTCTLSTN